ASGQLLMDQPNIAAIALLAIRKANEGLMESVDQPLAYQVLADAYSFLQDLETSVLHESGVNFVNQLRFNQALAAYHQAVLLEPDSANLRFRFVQLLQRHNRIDLALRELHEFERLTEHVSSDDPNFADTLRRIIPLKEQWLSRLDALREQIEKTLETGESPLEVAQKAYQAGFVLEALKQLDSDPVALQQSPQSLALRGLLWFESGQIELAYNQFEYESADNPL